MCTRKVSGTDRFRKIKLKQVFWGKKKLDNFARSR